MTGGWATLTAKYTPGLSLVSMNRNNLGCAPSRAFRESLPCFAEAPSEAEGDSRRGDPAPTADIIRLRLTLPEAVQPLGIAEFSNNGVSPPRNSRFHP